MGSGPLVPQNNRVVREIQSTQSLDLGRTAIPRLSPDLPSQESAIGDSLRVLQKHKWWVIGCFVAIVAVVAIASLRMPKIYQAGGTVEIDKPDNTLNFQNAATFNVDVFDPTELETEMQKLRSDALALQVSQELHLDRSAEIASQAPPSDLAPDPLQSDPSRAAAMVGSFKGNLKVSLVPNTRIIEVRFNNQDPQQAANVVNTLMKTFVENNRQSHYDSTMTASKWLQLQLVDLQMKVETSQEALVRYQKDHDILGIDDKQNITMAKLDALNQQLTAAESERMEKEALYRLVESGDPESIASSSGLLDDSGASSQSASGLLESLRTRQADIKIQAADLSTQFGPAYPKLTQLNNQLKEIDSQIKSEMKKVASKVRGQYNEALQRETLLQEAFETQKQQANKLNESAIKYLVLKREVDTNRQLYEGLLQKLKEAEVSSALKTNNFRVLDEATVPSGPIEPNIPRNLMFAAVLGLATGVGLAFLKEGMDNTVRTTEQAQMISGLASLGMIPLGTKTVREGPNSKRLVVASSNEAELVTLAKPQSQMAESYRALRTSLLLSNLGAPPKVIMVTSALPQEGKTTTSMNCAVVLAHKHARVLLIDADLRRPSIHRNLGIAPHVGLSNVLTGGKLADAITHTSNGHGLPDFDVLTAGTPPPNPAELLASTNMRDLLVQLRELYDHIVIDTPPALSVTDAVVLSPRADAVVLVIRSGKTSKTALRRSRDILVQVNAKVVGVLLNAVDLTSPDYYYYYEYKGKYAQYYREGDASEHDEENDTVEERPSSSSA